MEFKGKTVLITGSTSGIGKQLAFDFAKKGAKVIVNCRTSLKEGKEIKELIETKTKGECILGVGDVSDFDQIQKMRTSLKKKGVSEIHVLINNAGITRDKTLKKMTPDEWNSVISVNLSSVFNVTQIFLPLIPKGGRILSMASIVGVRGNFGQTNYAASKAGIIGFTKSLAREVGRSEITVNAIAPGFIKTPMIEKMPQEARDAILTRLVIPRFGEVEDISQTMLFLASKHASYITGQVIEITGGLQL